MSALSWFARSGLAAVLLITSGCSDSGSSDDPFTDRDPSTNPGDENPDEETPQADGSVKPAKSDASSGGGKGSDAGVVSKSDEKVDDGAGDPGEGTEAGKPPTQPTGSSCLDGITDYAGAGPFKFATKTSGSVKLWVPTVPADCKVPVVHLANGTGATCAAYQPVLERLASHGFLACCYEDTNTGAGTQGVMAIDTARTMYPDLVDDKIGSTGHSQGGQAAFTVLQLAEAKWGDSFVYAGLAMEPASGFGTQPAGGSWQSVYAKIKSPMFMFSGTADTLVSESWVKQAYDAMPKGNEVYNWSAIGATHIPVPNAPTQSVSVPWFRWKLLGDAKACEAFNALPDGKAWKETASENSAACQ